MSAQLATRTSERTNKHRMLHAKTLGCSQLQLCGGSFLATFWFCPNKIPEPLCTHHALATMAQQLCPARVAAAVQSLLANWASGRPAHACTQRSKVDIASSRWVRDAVWVLFDQAFETHLANWTVPGTCPERWGLLRCGVVPQQAQQAALSRGEPLRESCQTFESPICRSEVRSTAAHWAPSTGLGGGVWRRRN